MTERKIIITKDDESSEKFSPTECTCETCKGMNTGSIEWLGFSPTNNLQRRMKEVVSRIEEREARGEESSRRPKKRARK
jgi:hypothetical protein